jgi:hypothetical protein
MIGSAGLRKHAETPEATLLIECAAEARRLAPDHCARDLHTSETCAWYHGFWPYLRALGIVTTPETHRAFYAEIFGRLAREPGFRRILISGSADFNMLEQVYAAFDAAGATPEIVFVDRCPTSTALADWYAARTGRRIETHAGDILAFDAAPFDLICTHSFMGYFDDGARRKLAARWAALLRVGGKVVTINRVRPGITDIQGFSEQQATEFAEKARQAALALEHPLDLDAEEIAVAARRYAAMFRIHPVSSLDALRDFFEGNGFSLDLMDGRMVPGHTDKRVTGPTTPGGANYVHLIATRV